MSRDSTVFRGWDHDAALLNVLAPESGLKSCFADGWRLQEYWKGKKEKNGQIPILLCFKEGQWVEDFSTRGEMAR